MRTASLEESMAAGAVVVTGGATGIGLALAREFRKRGASVTVCGRRAETLAEVNGSDPSIRTVQADVTSAADRVRLLDPATHSGEPVSILVNNAGAFQPVVDRRTDLSDEVISRQIEVNLTAPVQLASAFLIDPNRPSSSMIINVGTLSAWLRIGSQAPYIAGKAGLHAWSESLRALVSDDDDPLRVVELMTPAIDTDMVRQVDTSKMSADEFAHRAVSAVERGHDEVTIGFDARAARWASRVAPGLLNRIVEARFSYSSAS